MTPILDDLPPSVRPALLGGTGVVLAAATALLGRSGWPDWAVHLAVIAIGGGVGAAWWEARKRFPPPPRPADGPHDRLRHVRLAAAPEAAGPSWNDRLAAHDPGFSVPLLHRALRALAGAGEWAAPRVESVELREGEIAVCALIPGRPDSVRLRVSRPRGVPFPRPDSAEHGWRVDGREGVAGVAPPHAPPADPGMPAARRALLLRDPSFDLDDFASFLREIRRELAEGDPAHLDPQGQADVAFHGAPGPVDGATPVRWLEVELDGWYERIEVEHGGTWLSLLRTVGDPGAPWKVWRLAPVGGGR
jgi:hypothetical protein